MQNIDREVQRWWLGVPRSRGAASQLPPEEVNYRPSPVYFRPLWSLKPSASTVFIYS